MFRVDEAGGIAETSGQVVTADALSPPAATGLPPRALSGHSCGSDVAHEFQDRATLEPMSVAHNHYSELHALVDRLAPERTADARRALLRLVAANPDLDTQGAVWAGPSFIGAFDSGRDDLSERVDEALFDNDGPGAGIR